MKKMEFPCEVITPMFLYGADKNCPEFRAASIKGIMRYWWRAVQAESDIGKMKEKEDRIFGDSGNEGKSKFSVVVKSEGFEHDRQNMLPHHTGDRNCPLCGNDKCKKVVLAKAIKPQQKFQVIFRYRQLPSDFTEEHLKALFKLTSILGGLGKRSRRGFGSFAVLSEPKEREIITRIKDLLEFLAPGNFELRDNAIKLIKTCNADYPFIRKIEVGKAYRTVDELLRIIGKASHNAAYGKNKEDFSLGTARASIRLASPVYVSVVKSGEGEYRPVITTLNMALQRHMQQRQQEQEKDTPKQKQFKEAIL